MSCIASRNLLVGWWWWFDGIENRRKSRQSNIPISTLTNLAPKPQETAMHSKNMRKRRLMPKRANCESVFQNAFVKDENFTACCVFIKQLEHVDAALKRMIVILGVFLRPWFYYVDILLVASFVFMIRSRWCAIKDISSVWVYAVKYYARWVENVFFPTLNYKYILLQH